MKQTSRAILAIALTLAAAAPTSCPAQAAPVAESANAPGVLTRPELEQLIPPSVYFQGQSATVQVRNSGGVRFPGGAIAFAVKVDTGGYSTSVQERYQDYLITETALQLGEGAAAKTLVPGAYGIGFLAGGLVVMDLGGHTLFTVPAPADAELRRPSPLQVLAHGAGFRLYSGRSYVAFAAAPQNGNSQLK
jgi:hypothetical protein